MEERAKAQLLSAYQSAEKATPPDMLEARRQAFLAKYPPESLGTLTGDALMRFVHGDAPRTGLFYDLEYGDATAGFGSIAGGGVLKFKVYRSGDGSVYRKKQPGVNAQVDCSDAEAEEMTTFMMWALAHALHWADEFNLSRGKYDDWRTFNQHVGADKPTWYDDEGGEQSIAFLVWAHKYLAIVRPDLFAFHHRWINLVSHILRLGIKPASPNGRYLLDWQWRNIVQEDQDLRELYSPLLMQAAYKALGAQTRYWRVGTTEVNVDRWQAMRAAASSVLAGKKSAT